MSSEADFNKDMKKFIQLIKKLLKNNPAQDKLKESQDKFSDGGVNINVFIFPLIPLTPEEMDELEEIYDYFSPDDEKSGEDLSSDLTESDRDFLKNHGIRF